MVTLKARGNLATRTGFCQCVRQNCHLEKQLQSRGRAVKRGDVCLMRHMAYGSISHTAYPTRAGLGVSARTRS